MSHQAPEGRGGAPQRQDEQPAPISRSAASKLFDLRYLIGGLFTLYGIVLIITGLIDGSAEVHKAAGVHINLWTGIGMLVLGLLFLLWARLRPLQLGAGESDAVDEPAAPSADR